MTVNAERRRGRHPDGVTSTHMTDQASRQRSAHVRGLVAIGVYYAPVGRRRMGAIIVRSCPACLNMHVHRSDGPVTSTTRAGSCGAEYMIRVVRIGGVTSP